MTDKLKRAGCASSPHERRPLHVFTIPLSPQATACTLLVHADSAINYIQELS